MYSTSIKHNCISFYAVLFLILLTAPAYPQIAIEWQRCIGTANNDESARAMKQTVDGGFIIAGASDINGTDCLLAKTDSAGNVQWMQTYGGSSYEYFKDVVACGDGGYLAVGYTNSNDGDVVGFHPGSIQDLDGWVVKTDASGNLLWQRALGGNQSDAVYSVVKNQNEEYIISGYALSVNGDLSGTLNPGQSTWVLRIDSVGNTIDQVVFGGNSNDVGFKITATTDGGYALACCSMGSGGVLDTSFGNWDVDIARLDSGLNVQWVHVYGGTGQEQMYDIKQTSDGGFIMCGETDSWNGYISGQHGNMDFWVVKTDSAGNFEWQKCLGSTYYEDAYTIVQTAGGNYILTGRMFGGAVDGDITDPIGSGVDFWIACLDATGILLWEKSIGGGSGEEAYALVATNDAEYAVAGYTLSNDRDVSGYTGAASWYKADIWLVKFTEHPNSITGTIFIDANANAVQDVAEISLPIHQVTETNSGRMAFSNSTGFYRMDVPAPGTYSVTADSVNYYSCIPATHTATFAGVDEIDSLNNFAFQPAGNINDLKVTITSFTNVRPGFPAMFHINYKNVGTTTLSGDVGFGFQNFMTYIGSTLLPTIVTADSIAWSYTSLLPYEERSIDVSMIVSAFVFIGTQVQNTASVLPFAGDATVADNRGTLSQLVVGSFDPNDITGDIDTLYMNQLAAPPFLEYTIRFQNTGNFPATFVRVTNPVSNLLDMSTFEILATSHVASTNFLAHSRNMEFFFDNINLSDSTTNEQASHGFIRYRIKPIANLSPGDSIRNLAYIYFDYNYPVATNTALTTIYYPVGIAENNESKNQLLIYPNPFENTITVNVQKQNVQHASFTVSNCLGQTLLSETQSNSDRSFTKTIDVGFLPEGMYFLTTTIDGRKTVNKIIRK